MTVPTLFRMRAHLGGSSGAPTCLDLKLEDVA